MRRWVNENSNQVVVFDTNSNGLYVPGNDDYFIGLFYYSSAFKCVVVGVYGLHFRTELGRYPRMLTVISKSNYISAYMHGIRCHPHMQTRTILDWMYCAIRALALSGPTRPYAERDCVTACILIKIYLPWALYAFSCLYTYIIDALVHKHYTTSWMWRRI